MKKFIRRFFELRFSLFFKSAHVYLQSEYNKRIEKSKNPLNAFEYGIFSQNGEDGITFEIIKRLKLEKGSFAEFGVGDGLENNTLALMSMGWKGFWVGNEELGFTVPKSAENKFIYEKAWVDLDNINSIYKNNCALLGFKDVDVLSLDFDGNDYYFIAELYKNYRPKVFILEYNGKFMPPVDFKIDYDGHDYHNMTDYFGASLQAWINLLSADYKLVACNVSGVNAFFVHRDYADLFSDVPDDINDIFHMYAPYLTHRRSNLPNSPKTVETILRNL